MATDSINGVSSATTTTDSSSGAINPNGILGKDDFLKLLLVELQYQDPTEPMDSEKILSQTSQLATLEASENTNKALEELAASLATNRDFSTIAAIGKLADTGSNALQLEEGATPSFEMYFANDVDYGTISIMDSDGNTLSSMEVPSSSAGIQQFEWNGKDTQGNTLEEGIYYVTASYTDPEGAAHETRIGLYPIESVRFEEGETMVKLGSTYWPFGAIKEVLEG